MWPRVGKSEKGAKRSELGAVPNIGAGKAEHFNNIHYSNVKGPYPALGSTTTAVIPDFLNR